MVHISERKVAKNGLKSLWGQNGLKTAGGIFVFFLLCFLGWISRRVRRIGGCIGERFYTLFHNFGAGREKKLKNSC